MATTSGVNVTYICCSASRGKKTKCNQTHYYIINSNNTFGCTKQMQTLEKCTTQPPLQKEYNKKI
jgi:hypothetical protein